MKCQNLGRLIVMNRVAGNRNGVGDRRIADVEDLHVVESRRMSLLRHSVVCSRCLLVWDPVAEVER